METRVAREVAELGDLPRTDLASRWRAAFGGRPPKNVPKTIMHKALAYEIQKAAFGGLGSGARRALRAAAGGGPAPRTLAVGGRLVRVWNGRTYEVEVVEGGYRWRGETWSSLSAIAAAITGTKWSGPRFFGLKKRT